MSSLYIRLRFFGRCWRVEPNSGRNKNVMEHKAPTCYSAADGDYANECSTEPHYEPRKELVFLGNFTDEVLLEVVK